MKNKETLEEAAVEYANKELSQELTSKIGNFYGFSSSFIEGAKWMQERSYSEEDMAESFMACWTENVPYGFECKLSFNEWFEQFKNNKMQKTNLQTQNSN